jgi:hypothetical protein
MKLKTFSPENLPSARNLKPAIGLNHKSGTLRFNSAFVEKLGIKPDCLVQYHQDEEEPSDWYIEIVKKDGFVLREKSGQTGAGGLVMQSTALVRRIFDSIAYTGLAGNISAGDPVQHSGKKLWPLITVALVNA